MRRYDIAKQALDLFPSITRTIDYHALGIWFTETHGYLLDRIYALRFTHTDPVKPLFFHLPTETVVENCGWHSLTSRVTITTPLFKEERCNVELADQLFKEKSDSTTFDMVTKDLIETLNAISTKREREKSVLGIRLCGNEVISTLIARNKTKNWEVVNEEKSPITNIVEKDTDEIFLHSNALLSVLYFFSQEEPVSFELNRDRIKITAIHSKSKVEGVISSISNKKAKKVATGMLQEI